VISRELKALEGSDHESLPQHRSRRILAEWATRGP
jgi:hypothetical protein